jgi:pullulanase
VAGYNILRNGTKVGTSATTSYTDSGLSVATAYTYAVSAYDAAGDTSATSASIFVTTAAAVVPPTAPTGLTAGTVTSSSAALSWTASTSSAGVAGYNILRNGTKVGTSTTTSYTDSGLSAATAYTYTVSAYDASGNTSSASSSITVTTLAVVVPPTAPTGLTAGTITSSSVALSWTASTSSAGVAGYNILRSGVKVGTSTTTSYTDTGLLASTSYSYTVTAFDSAGNTSAASAALSVTTLGATGQVPATPTGFSAVENTGYCNVVQSWNAAGPGASAIAGYQILRNGALLATTANLTYNDTSTAPNTTYTYDVAAYDANGSVSVPTSTISVSTGACTAAQALRLGVMYTPAQSTFSIWSPDSSNVVLNLNGTQYPMSPVADANGYTDVYSVVVTGDQLLQTYNFQINGVTSRDPYGVMVQPGTNNNIVLDPSQATLPEGWTPIPDLANRVDSIIYETHVRDFTEDPSSGIPADERGTYEGMTLAGTTVNGVAGAPSTGIDHLVDMGVTHIQLMPVTDFNSCNPTDVASNADCYNWGYDPENYNVPEERYSQTPTDASLKRIAEFKAMIDGFHKRGIRVILDVVYNHTADESVLGNITSKYYLGTDISGVGNTLDGSQPMVARMIQDSLEYWVTQYNVDGFRFDLLGVFPVATVEGWAQYLTTTYPNRNLLLYGEPWTGASSDPNWPTQLGFSTVGTIASSHVGVFNGGYRGALKGTNDNAGGNTGFIFNQGTSDSYFGSYAAGKYWPGTTLGLGAISEGVEASPLASLPATALSSEWDASYTAAPEQAINYVSVHDNLCLADKVGLWADANGHGGDTALQAQLIQYAASIVLTSQGIPFLYGGDEFQRTKQYNSNSYNASDAVNDFNWTFLQTYAPTYTYVKALIALRKAHPGFRFTTWSDINTNVLSDQRSASLVYTQINASANSDTWNTVLLIYNSGAAQTINLPAGNWRVAVQNSTAPSGSDPSVSGTVTAASAAITLLYQ